MKRSSRPLDEIVVVGLVDEAVFDGLKLRAIIARPSE
jgi:hypothetical protein